MFDRKKTPVPAAKLQGIIKFKLGLEEVRRWPGSLTEPAEKPTTFIREEGKLHVRENSGRQN